MSVHYVAIAGLRGCLPSYTCGAESYDDAVGVLADLYELGARRRQALKRDGYLDLNLRRDGNEYCEVVECDCPDGPDAHDI